ncbi:hypothetical protein GPECTOR_26g612 [Gonium pectorale]|uniref:Uncharacterized protein n=1 Tax=Gonium pectorale TaxID=33097 RepID=A0A150GFU6_GONPE|nr:hypothetical protein GPECTOR_26g612 [Gonium pectorale]|eukprot:KXZ48709.1 hypothetical protein GPECTOR_26g612 [Gonium pectorale]
MSRNAMFRLPLDAYFLLFPISCAAAALVTMVARVPARDPEATRNPAFYEDEKYAAQVGRQYENDIKSLFDMRIRARKFTVFNNEVEIPK